MTRSFPSEIYIGTTVWFYVEPQSPPLASRVVDLDYKQGRVRVQPIGYQDEIAATPRAICDQEGHILDFKDNDFIFSSLVRA